MGTDLGAPGKFLCGNGDEFANNVFLEMCENMNIQVMHTAAYSPFSNGLCERDHALIDEMMVKIISEQPELSLRVALAWAINAKNCLQMVGGFSPYQLVYGWNPRLPCTMSDDLPALGGTSSEMVAKHLNASHSARKAFISAETSDKIQWALRHKVRTTVGAFKNGDKVYFKREEKKEWKGPATVIGKDGKTLILKYGSYIVRAHETHVQKIPFSFNKDSEEGRKGLLEVLRHQREERKESTSNQKEIEAVVNSVVKIVEGKSSDKTDKDEYHTATESITKDSVVVKSIPGVGQKVQFQLKSSNEWPTGTVHSQAGKSAGK